MNSNLCNKTSMGCKSKTQKSMFIPAQTLPWAKNPSGHDCRQRPFINRAEGSWQLSQWSGVPEHVKQSLWHCTATDTHKKHSQSPQTTDKVTVYKHSLKLWSFTDFDHHYHLCSNKKEPVGLQLWQYICIFLRHYTNPNVTTNGLIYLLYEQPVKYHLLWML